MSDKNTPPAVGETYWTCGLDGKAKERVWVGGVSDRERLRNGFVHWSPQAATLAFHGEDYFGPGDILPSKAEAEWHHRNLRMVDLRREADGAWERAPAFKNMPDAVAYRIAPFREGYVQLPEPMRRAPGVGAPIWIMGEGRAQWDGTPRQFHHLRMGLIFKDARDFYAALAAISQVTRHHGDE